MAGKGHKFTVSLSRETYPTTCSGWPATCHVLPSTESSMDTPPLDRFLGELSVLRCGICGFIKGPFGNMACIWVQRETSCGNLVLTITENAGKISLLVLLSGSVTSAGATNSDLALSLRPVLCKVMTKTQISLFSSSRSAGLRCTELYQNQEVPALTQLNFQSCLET